MSAHIGNLKDENGDTFYPVTKTNAVFDENNVDIGTTMSTMSNNINYSTSEVAIGKWTDGSTIYRKVFNYTSANTNQQWTGCINLSSLNIKAIIRIYGSQGDGSTWVNLPVSEGQYYRNFRYAIGTGWLEHINNGFNNANGYIAVEYIKN